MSSHCDLDLVNSKVFLYLYIYYIYMGFCCLFVFVGISQADRTGLALMGENLEWKVSLLELCYTFSLSVFLSLSLFFFFLQDSPPPGNTASTWASDTRTRWLKYIYEAEVDCQKTANCSRHVGAPVETKEEAVCVARHHLLSAAHWQILATLKTIITIQALQSAQRKTRETTPL